MRPFRPRGVVYQISPTGVRQRRDRRWRVLVCGWRRAWVGACLVSDLRRQREANVTQTLMSIGAGAYWYPGVQRRFYLRGGAALVMHRASDGTDVVTSSGIGPQPGIGSEHAASRAWLVAPFLHYSVGVFGGDVKFNGGQAADRATVSFLQVGVSLTRR